MPLLTKPRVTLFTPVYNGEKYIQETIESIVSQDYPNLEYIILNDGSIDGTEKIIEKYTSMPSLYKMRYQYHENKGETATVNMGYAMAEGEYIGIINADDPLLSTHAISRMIEVALEQPDCLAVYPDWISIDSHGNETRKIALPDYTLENMLLAYSVSLGPGMLIKKETLARTGLREPSLVYTGDLDLAFRVALLGEFAHVPEFLATHRTHGEAASTTGKGEQMAREVARIGELTLESPLLPESLRKQRNAILERVWNSAIRYAGNDDSAQLLYIMKILNLDHK